MSIEAIHGEQFRAKPAPPDRPARLRGFMAGMMLPLGVAFAILGGGQVGLSVLFLLNF